MGRRSLSIIVLLALATGARAQDLRREARAHSDLGAVAFERGRFREALVEYEKAYEAAPIPELLYNIGRCHEGLRETAEAIAAYRRYLAARPDAEDRAELEAHVAELERASRSPSSEAAPAPPPKPAPATTAPESPKPVIAPARAIPLVGSAPEREPRTPLYKRWWLWSAVSAVAIGAGLGIGLGVALHPSAAGTSFPGVQATPCAGAACP